APYRLDRLLLQRAYGRTVPFLAVDQADAVAADAQQPLQPLVDGEQPFVFEEPGRILPATRSQMIAQLDAERLYAARDGAGAAASDADDDDGALRGGRIGGVVLDRGQRRCLSSSSPVARGRGA